jgi:hypothetical protein
VWSILAHQWYQFVADLLQLDLVLLKLELGYHVGFVVGPSFACNLG